SSPRAPEPRASRTSGSSAANRYRAGRRRADPKQAAVVAGGDLRPGRRRGRSATTTTTTTTPPPTPSPAPSDRVSARRSSVAAVTAPDTSATTAATAAPPPFTADAVRAAYNGSAARYAELFADPLLRDYPVERALLAAFAELVRASGGLPVADLGCGPGYLTAHLSSLGL